MVVGCVHASAQTAVVGWSESKRADVEQIARDLTNAFGATPDTLVLTPGHAHIVFDNPPFAPIWATPGPRGGTVCHDLGPMIMRDIAKPIARYVYMRSPDRNVDTFTVVLHLASRHGVAGCWSTARIGFAAAELRPVRTLVSTSLTTLPSPPTRDPGTPGFVAAKELPDGNVPPVDADGNFVIGPTHTPAFETVVNEGVPQGAVHTFTMRSADSKIFPGIARDSGTFGTVSPTDPATLVVTTSHPAPYTRTVVVYVPAQYVPGTIAPFIVGADGPDQSLFTVLDNLIAEKRVPAMIAISIGNGGGDAQGSERGLEYDTMSGRYAEFVESEVLPLVERQYNVKLTKDPEGRATMGGSSGGSAAFIMAWYHPELYHRVLAYSITAVNQQWPHSDDTPHGAWEFHDRIIPNSPVKPIRVWLEVGDRDFLNPNVMRDGMHDWVVASENMARVLAAKGYHYQFVFARNAGHVDRGVKQQTIPEALEWLWRGYAVEGRASSNPGSERRAR
jgi:iron(III)-enterobactin esterase